MRKTDYAKSNDVTEVCYKRLSKSEFKAFMSSDEDCDSRQENAQRLLEYLCGKFSLPMMHVYFVNIRQPRKYGKTWYAFYYYNNHSVRVFNLSSKAGKPISMESVSDTIIHEFMHHYDRYRLKIESSPHTRGFYLRIKDLLNKLQ